jgi:hypothetical protein
MVTCFPSMVPVTGMGSFSLGPTQPVIVSPVCFSDALPVIVLLDVEIVTCQFPVTSAAKLEPMMPARAHLAARLVHSWFPPFDLT